MELQREAQKESQSFQKRDLSAITQMILATMIVGFAHSKTYSNHLFPLSCFHTCTQRTTTLNGKFTSRFTGTSASAPLLAGTIALALEAK